MLPMSIVLDLDRARKTTTHYSRADHGKEVMGWSCTSMDGYVRNIHAMPLKRACTMADKLGLEIILARKEPSNGQT